MHDQSPAPAAGPESFLLFFIRCFPQSDLSALQPLGTLMQLESEPAEECWSLETTCPRAVVELILETHAGVFSYALSLPPALQRVSAVSHPRGRQAAQSLVEFAFIIPLLLLLLLGAIDALQSLMTHYTVAQAVKVASHDAALSGGDVASAKQIAQSILDTGFGTDSKKAVITVTCATPCHRYSAVTVSIDYQDDLWVPIGPFDSVHALASATRATEQDHQTTTSTSSSSPPSLVPGSTTSLPGGVP